MSTDPDYFTVEDNSLVVDTNLAQLARFGTDRAVCGNCKHFAKSEGQDRIRKQKVIDTFVKEHGWKLHYLGSDPNQLGICGEYESGANGTGGKGSLITGPLHVGCEAFKPKNGAIGGGR